MKRSQLNQLVQDSERSCTCAVGGLIGASQVGKCRSCLAKKELKKAVRQLPVSIPDKKDNVTLVFPRSIDELWIIIEPGCKVPDHPEEEVFLWTEHGGLIYTARYMSRYTDGHLPWGSHATLNPLAWMPRPKGPRRKS